MRQEARRIRLVLLDGHELVRTAICHLLETHGFDIVGDFGNIARCVEEVAGLHPDIVLMEMQLDEVSAVRACQEIRARCPGSRIIFLSSVNDEEARVSSILAGAECFLSKNIRANDLVRTIEAVATGHTMLDAATVRQLRERMQIGQLLRGNIKSLSPQEHRILPFVAAGKTNKEIGEAIGLSHRTVKNHLSSVYQKLQVTRRAQVAAIFARSEVNKPATPTHTG